jgi:hypothetical protein
MPSFGNPNLMFYPGEAPGADLPPSPTMTTQQPSARDRLLASITSPEGVAAISMGGLGIGQSLLQNRANSRENERDRAMTREQLLAQLYGDEQDDLRLRQQGHMNTFAMDPVAQQRAMFGAGLLRDVAANGPARIAPGQGVTNPASISGDTLGFLSQEALADNASRFYAAAGSLAGPGAPSADLASMGFGAAGAARQPQMDATISAANDRYETLGRERRDALMRQVVPEQQEDDDDGGGGVWGFLKKTLPFAAMAIPFVGPAVGMGALATSGLAAGVGVGGALANRNPMGAAQHGANFGQDYFNRRGGR